MKYSKFNLEKMIKTTLKDIKYKATVLEYRWFGSRFREVYSSDGSIWICTATGDTLYIGKAILVYEASYMKNLCDFNLYVKD